MGVKRSCRLRARNDANDPTETWAAQDFRSAKALFVPSLKRDIVPSIACTRPPTGGSHGNPPPTARIHIHTGRRGVVAARSASAAAGQSPSRRHLVGQRAVSECSPDGGLPARLARTWLRRRAESCHRGKRRAAALGSQPTQLYRPC